MTHGLLWWSLSPRQAQQAAHPIAANGAHPWARWQVLALGTRKLAFMSSTTQESFRIGKLLFTPFSRLAEDGRYKAGLSIKRGQGSSTHDRVSIYVPTFTSVEGALIYARAMGNYESNDLALAA